MMTWLMIEVLRNRTCTLTGACIGCVAGLVVSSPAAGFVSPQWATLMGVIAAVVIYPAISMKNNCQPMTV